MLLRLHTRFRDFLDELDRGERGVAGHSLAVCKTALRIARRLDVDEERLPLIAVGAVLHDIGKVFVDGRLLAKSEPLSAAELELIRLHPQLGEALLGPQGWADEVLGIVRSHHERWDGTGYPDRLAGTAIPLGARIVAAADAFVAMREARAYRPALESGAVLDELGRLAGDQFDADCVEGLVRSFSGDAYRTMRQRGRAVRPSLETPDAA